MQLICAVQSKLKFLYTADLLNLMVTKEQQISRCKSNRDTWIEINELENNTINSNQVFSAVPTINEALARILELTATSKPVCTF
jgi:hypothetical protein